MPKNVIVVGAPRSGTSMASYIFARKGYFVAEKPDEELHAGDEHNPTGYWEAERLVEANVELFRTVGYPCHNTWLFEPITDDQVQRIASVPAIDQHRRLIAQYDAHAPWLWKDPRLCCTLGYWWPMVNPKTTAVLLIRRKTEHVFKSFVRMGWRNADSDPAEVAERVRTMLAVAERTIARLKIPHVDLAYEDFASRPGATARTIADVFELELSENDLQFDNLLNHSSARGAMIVRMERLAAALPAGLRRFIKRLTPRAVLKRLFPGHN